MIINTMSIPPIGKCKHGIFLEYVWSCPNCVREREEEQKARQKHLEDEAKRVYARISPLLTKLQSMGCYLPFSQAVWEKEEEERLVSTLERIAQNDKPFDENISKGDLAKLGFQAYSLKFPSLAEFVSQGFQAYSASWGACNTKNQYLLQNISGSLYKYPQIVEEEKKRRAELVKKAEERMQKDRENARIYMEEQARQKELRRQLDVRKEAERRIAEAEFESAVEAEVKKIRSSLHRSS